jgi:hypothetical protein
LFFLHFALDGDQRNRCLDPLPEVSACIEPLGPAPLRHFSPAPTWSQAVAALNPIRELEPGARPRDWVDGTQRAASASHGSSAARLDHGGSAGEHAQARVDANEAALARQDGDVSADEAALAPAELSALARPDPDVSADEAVIAPADVAGPAVGRLEAAVRTAELARVRLEPQRYKVQFGASEEYVELVEKAKALLSHAAPRLDLGDLHLRAMRALVAELERARYAVTTRQRVARGSAAASEGEQPGIGKLEPESKSERKSGAERKSEPGRESESHHPRRRGRHIPAAIRRAVFERDAGRCTYRSDSAERCRATARLELHHSMAFTQGGEHRLDNVSLRCRAHNALAAEEDFGRDFVTSARDSSQHELWARHVPAPTRLPTAGRAAQAQDRASRSDSG